MLGEGASVIWDADSSRLRSSGGWERAGLKPTQAQSAFLRWTEVQLPLLKQGAPTERRIPQTYRLPMMTGLGAFLRNAWRRLITGERGAVQIW